jgi:hypothetical protein
LWGCVVGDRRMLRGVYVRRVWILFVSGIWDERVGVLGHLKVERFVL